MTKLYLIRHGEAEGNIYRRAQGWYNSLITPRGYRQLAALRDRFADIPVEAVYSSDLFRTQTTARAIYEPKGLPLITLPWLREIGLGPWEDTPWAALTLAHGQELAWFNTDLERWYLEGAETGAGVQKRMLAAVKLLSATHPGQTIAAVTHGSALRILLAAAEGIALSQIGTAPHSDNTAVTLLEIDGDALRIVFRDDNSHLLHDPTLSTLGNQSWWKKKNGLELGIWYAPAQPTEDFFALLQATGTPVTPQQARQCHDHCSDALWTARQGQEAIGALVLDTRRGLADKEGHIAGLGLLPQHRRNTFGRQLVGQALSVYRPMGRQYLTICLPQDETLAAAFDTYGFVRRSDGSSALYVGYEPREF